MSRYDSYGNYDDKQIDVFDTTFAGFNNRLKPDALPSGMLTSSKNFRFDLEGIAQTRKGITLTKAPLALDANSAFTIPFYLYANITASSASVTTNTVTLNFSSAHGIVDETLVSVSGMTGLTNYADGNFKANRVDADTIEITSTSVSGTPSGTIVVGAPKLASAFTTQVYGSCNYSDFFNDGVEYIILAGNDKAYAIKLSDQSSTEITYPAGVQISSRVDMIQGLNRVFIFRDGQTALEFSGNLSGSPAFTKVSSGPYTQPKILKASGNTAISANGLATVTETSHGLESGDVIEVISASFLPSDVSSYTITKVDANSFTFPTNAVDASSQNGQYIGRVSVGSGYIHMPAPPYGVAHDFRLVVPYFYDPTTTDNFTARNVDDEILTSFPNRADKYDTPYSTLGTSEGGVNDRLVGLFSFADDKLLLFNRKSISLVSGIGSLNFQDTVRQLITSELGLVARKSVVQIGNQIMFLSDNGVYGVSFQDLYNLRGNEVPLSEAINGTFERINKAYWENSVSVYFDNRYYLAVPLNGEDGTEATSNNAILIFNFLNKQWESIDSVGSTSTTGTTIDFDIQDMIVAGDGDDRGVYVVNTLGGVHKLDGSTNGFDSVITQIGGSEQRVDISSEITTREYNGGIIDRKKWSSFEMQCESSPELVSDFKITGITTNLDKTLDLQNLSTYNGGEQLPAGEDVSIRGRIGNPRGYSLQMKIEPTLGRPKIKIIKASGTKTFKSYETAI